MPTSPRTPWLPIAGLALSLSACTTTPVAPLPAPLPETLEWAAAPIEGAGAFLGLKTRENLATSFDALDFPPGVHVTRVVENSPAASAAIQVGDVVLSFDGESTDDPATLDALVAGRAPGARVPIEVQRGDSVFRVEVELGAPAGDGAQVTAEPVARLDPARSRAGWLTGRGGVVLVSSHPDAPFPKAGVEVGSVVHALDGEGVHSDRALVARLQALAPGSRVSVEFAGPDGEVREAKVRLQGEERKVTEFSIPILTTYRSDVSGEESSFVLIDLWLISLFRYQRLGEERTWSFLRFFRFSTGVGELGS